MRGDELVLIDIDLSQYHAAIRIFRRDLFQNRRQLLARPAPFGPKVQNYEPLHGRRDDVDPELLDGFLFVGGEAQRRQGYFSNLQDSFRPLCGQSGVFHKIGFIPFS